MIGGAGLVKDRYRHVGQRWPGRDEALVGETIAGALVVGRLDYTDEAGYTDVSAMINRRTRPRSNDATQTS